MIKKLRDIEPNIHNDAFIADSADVIGDVTIDEGSSIWYNAVVRGDIESIKIGKYTNIQDNATVHTETNIPTEIGDYSVIGHNAVVHGCKVGDNCLIGMGAIVLNGSVIGDNSIIGAGSVITEGKIIPPNSLVVGVPGKILRELTEVEIGEIKKNALRYYDLWKENYIE